MRTKSEVMRGHPVQLPGAAGLRRGGRVHGVRATKWFMTPKLRTLHEQPALVISLRIHPACLLLTVKTALADSLDSHHSCHMRTPCPEHAFSCPIERQK